MYIPGCTYQGGVYTRIYLSSKVLREAERPLLTSLLRSSGRQGGLKAAHDLRGEERGIMRRREPSLPLRERASLCRLFSSLSCLFCRFYTFWQEVKLFFLPVLPFWQESGGLIGPCNGVSHGEKGVKRVNNGEKRVETPYKPVGKGITWESPLITGKAAQDLEGQKEQKEQKPLRTGHNPLLNLNFSLEMSLFSSFCHFLRGMPSLFDTRVKPAHRTPR